VYANLAPPLVIGLGFGGFWLVWLVASFVPVDAQRLPSLLRVMRIPVSKRIPSGTVQIGVPFRTGSSEQLWVWRLLAAIFVILSQTIQVRSATDAKLATTMGSAPLLAAYAEWLLMLAWSVYVVLEFRRTQRKSRP